MVCFYTLFLFSYVPSTAATVGAPSQSKDVGQTSGASSIVAGPSTGQLSAASTSPSSQRSVN